MRTAFHATRFALTVGAFSGVLISASGYAADLNEVRITFDKDVAARTNMQREPGDSSVLGVTFDQDISKRTNMQREASDVGTVNVSPGVTSNCFSASSINAYLNPAARSAKPYECVSVFFGLNSM